MTKAREQTNGRLLVAVEENSVEKVKQILFEGGIEFIKPIGRFIKAEKKIIMVK
jgi:hypothetical protein